MDLTSVTPESILAQNASLAMGSLAMKVERKVLDLAQTSGAELAKLVDSSGGVGKSISTYA